MKKKLIVFKLLFLESNYIYSSENSSIPFDKKNIEEYDENLINLIIEYLKRKNPQNKKQFYTNLQQDLFLELNDNNIENQQLKQEILKQSIQNYFNPKYQNTIEYIYKKNFNSDEIKKIQIQKDEELKQNTMNIATEKETERTTTKQNIQRQFKQILKDFSTEKILNDNLIMEKKNESLILYIKVNEDIIEYFSLTQDTIRYYNKFFIKNDDLNNDDLTIKIKEIIKKDKELYKILYDNQKIFTNYSINTTENNDTKYCEISLNNNNLNIKDMDIFINIKSFFRKRYHEALKKIQDNFSKEYEILLNEYSKEINLDDNIILRKTEEPDTKKLYLEICIKKIKSKEFPILKFFNNQIRFFNDTSEDININNSIMKQIKTIKNPQFQEIQKNILKNNSNYINKYLITTFNLDNQNLFKMILDFFKNNNKDNDSIKNNDAIKKESNLKNKDESIKDQPLQTPNNQSKQKPNTHIFVNVLIFLFILLGFSYIFFKYIKNNKKKHILKTNIHNKIKKTNKRKFTKFNKKINVKKKNELNNKQFIDKLWKNDEVTDDFDNELMVY